MWVQTISDDCTLSLPLQTRLQTLLAEVKDPGLRLRRCHASGAPEARAVASVKDPVDRVNVIAELVQQTNYIFACVAIRS